ncbi:MAG: hypothetical protein DWC04_00225 [Candidatus Poseidoniales archaeon]|nr:MAG: hypothetical protein DWC04_00225 [Candidatus Poseidoniales archaeon]
MADAPEDREPPVPPRDDVLRKREFQKAKGIDLSSFMVEQEEDIPQPAPQNRREEMDEAVGEVASMFSSAQESEHGPGAVLRDGTVANAPELDSVEDLAVHGERRLSLGLLVAMVTVWSAIGAVVGTVLPPVPSGLGLMSMGLLGLYLGERWIPRPSMRLLGVTWVIISMKLFYGLALDAWHWGWFDASPIGASETLGVALLAVISGNIFIAQRHNEDAIAAQATLVLLVVGSAAGALYGQWGVAVMIGLGTLLMHGLAFMRTSGNLASLGIASSYLWVGVHALSDNWNFFGVNLVPFEDDLLLFLLMAGVTATNAVVAASFVRAENWFSSALEALGLGKPALWSVSVGLGMIGALFAIAAHRLETGYALAQLLLLVSAFSASYLVVRGVHIKQLAPFVLYPAPVMLIGLSLLESGAFDIGFLGSLSPYSLYAAITAACTAAALLQNQTSVSDHVLWMGGGVIVILLTLLIPAGEVDGNGRLLLVSQAVVWIGLSWLAVQRKSPSIAGTAVLAPWIWLMLFATDAESRIISMDLIPIVLNEVDLALWMSVLVVQQISVNVHQGETGLNLAARLAGASEIGARFRDSGFAKLWNLSFVLSAFVVWAVARPGSLPMPGLLGVMGILLFGHALMVWRGRHMGKPRSLMTVWGIFALILVWQYGQSAFWAMILVASCGLMLLATDRRRKEGASLADLEIAEALPGRLLTLMLGFLSAFYIVISLEPVTNIELTGAESMLSPEANLVVLSCVGLVALVLYLNRAATLEKLLPPAFGALGLIVTMGLAGTVLNLSLVILTAILAFVGSGVYLAIQGEFRAGLRALAKRDNRLARIQEKRERMEAFIAATSAVDQGEVVELSTESILEQEDSAQEDTRATLRLIDTELLDLAEKQRKRSKNWGTSGRHDLEIGDIHHQPVITLMFLITTILATTVISFMTGATLLALGFGVMLSLMFVGAARLRANEIGLRLPDIMGIEAPIAVGMAGLVLIHVAGRASNSVVELDSTDHLLVLLIGLLMLSGLGLIGRNDLGLRLPNALEGVVFLALIDRVVCLLIGGEVPIPFATDPFASLGTEWTAPLVGVEAILIGAVLGFDWVEGKRIDKAMADHRGASGRAAWVLAVSVLSFGIAGLLALACTARRSVWWQQPAPALVAWVGLPVVVQGIMAWLPSLLGVDPLPIYLVTSLMAFITIGFVVWTVMHRVGLWLPSGLWALHILLFVACFGFPSLIYAVVFILLASTVSWVSGILTLRKGWRIVGALDLVLAWIVAAIVLISGSSVSGLLAILLASAALLGVVTWLTQTFEGEMANE